MCVSYAIRKTEVGADTLKLELQGLRTALRVLGKEPGLYGTVVSVLCSLNHHLFSPIIFCFVLCLDEIIGYTGVPNWT